MSAEADTEINKRAKAIPTSYLLGAAVWDLNGQVPKLIHAVADRAADKAVTVVGRIYGYAEDRQLDRIRAEAQRLEAEQHKREVQQRDALINEIEGLPSVSVYVRDAQTPGDEFIELHVQPSAAELQVVFSAGWESANPRWMKEALKGVRWRVLHPSDLIRWNLQFDDRGVLKRASVKWPAAAWRGDD